MYDYQWFTLAHTLSPVAEKTGQRCAPLVGSCRQIKKGPCFLSTCCLNRGSSKICPGTGYREQECTHASLNPRPVNEKGKKASKMSCLFCPSSGLWAVVHMACFCMWAHWTVNVWSNFKTNIFRGKFEEWTCKICIIFSFENEIIFKLIGYVSVVNHGGVKRLFWSSVILDNVYGYCVCVALFRSIYALGYLLPAVCRSSCGECMTKYLCGKRLR